MKYTSVDRFIKRVIDDTRNFKVKLILHPNSNIDTWGGWFSCSPRVLACAIGGDINEWLPILVHEFSHFEQWKDNSPLFFKTITHEGIKYCPSDLYMFWIEKELELDDEKLNECYKNIHDVELDCEKRSLENIKKYQLPINKKIYVKRASAYLTAYSWAKIRRKWVNQCYKIEEIVENMPDKLKKSYDNPDDEIMKIYDKYYKKQFKK